jgi:hypothetical protein
MNEKPGFASWITLVIIATVWGSFWGDGQCQIVGDTFVDPSDWVQSNSPIRVSGIRQGDRDRSENVKAVVFVAEKSGVSLTPNGTRVRSLNSEMVSGDPRLPNAESPKANASALRPIPDPFVQGVPSRSSANSTAVHQTNLRGFAAPAAFFGSTGPEAAHSPAQAYRSVPSNTAGINPAASNAMPWRPASNTLVSPVSTLTNCCNPVYTQTQFVTPQLNANPNALRTYPQYNGNPYPNPGYGFNPSAVGDTWVPMIPLRSMPYGTHLGQGIIGQPVAYVPGEVVRNFLRYVFP